MRPIRIAPVLLGLLGVIGLAAPASGQPVVGASATYRWTSARTQQVPVLVQQRGPGDQVTWSVTQEAAAPPPIFVTYAVVRGDARTYTLQVVTSEAADGPPLSVTHITVDQTTGKATRSVIQYPKGTIPTPESDLRPLKEAGVPQGRREDVTVAAGRFTAVHGQVGAMEVWVSDQVPVLGIVKAVWRDSGALELVGSAPSGAKDLLGKR